MVIYPTFYIPNQHHPACPQILKVEHCGWEAFDASGAHGLRYTSHSGVSNLPSQPRMGHTCLEMLHTAYPKIFCTIKSFLSRDGKGSS
jgi:hypothetical protein